MLSRDPATRSAAREPIEELAEEYLARQRCGEQPTIEEFAARHPELSDLIRELFPALELLERFKPHLANRTGRAPAYATGEPPFMMGDFRVLRRIAQGGMGVVYEAEQASLGRRVALKVPSQSLHADGTRKARFEHEARAAARLHHTNIVPVFGVGEHEGTQYYVMQLIEGNGLDQLLAEPTVSVSARELRRAAIRPATGESRGTPLGSFRRVALLGAQVAEALQYAHDEGILHRDIKPSNLLLDSDGHIWVTDFGLAKAVDEQSLTRTGDIVGTFRYMAPERFRGEADARSDLYSLGLTLYEMMALRPAFFENDPGRLARQVVESRPPPLRTVAPETPRDLAIIIEKAIEPAPADRYQTARALADDLYRYVDDEPILARTPSVGARLLRWCRKNSQVAALTFLLAALLVAGLVTASLVALRMGRLAADREAARIAADDAVETARRRLYESLFSQARLRRWSNHPGQRFAALAALQQANKLANELAMSGTDRDPLRNEIIAALALSDLAVSRQWEPQPPTMLLDSIDFTPDLRYYTLPHGAAISVRRAADDRIVAVLPHPGGEGIFCRFSPDATLLGVGYEFASGQGTFALWNWTQQQLIATDARGVSKLSIDFTRDNRRVAIGQLDGAVRVLDCLTGTVVAEWQAGEAPHSVRWNPKETLLAISCRAHGSVTLWNPHEDRVVRRLEHPRNHDVLGLAWHPQGRQLAAGCERSIYLWDMDDEVSTPTILEGHSWLVHNLEYHPGGNHLVSHGWEGKTRLWDARRLQQVVAIDGHFVRFSPDGQQLGFRTGSHLGIWITASSRECVPVSAKLFAAGTRSGVVHQAAFHPSLPLLAAVCDAGVKIWNTDGFQELLSIGRGNLIGIDFDPRQGNLLLCHRTDLQHIPLQLGGAERTTITLGHPHSCAAPSGTEFRSAAQDAHGKVLAAVLRDQGRAVVFRAGSAETTALVGSPHMAWIAVSPDGHWAVTGQQHHPGFEIWDITSGQRVKELMTSGTGIAAFSPDGRWMVTADGDRYQFWSVPEWLPRHYVLRRDVPTGGFLAAGAAAFSADSQILAVASNQYLVQLVDASNGRQLATLEQTPNPTLVNGLRFSPDDRYLAVCCGTEGLCVWDLALVRQQMVNMGLRGLR